MRLSMAIMFIPADGSTLERAGLLRARAYAEAAVRDFQSYNGHAATAEAAGQRLLEGISKRLATLPQ